jgi:protein-S-isoprenylcysteine O-methyltransferase Ste14
MLKLSAFRIWTKYPYFWHWFVNTMVASVYCYYAYENLMNLSTTAHFMLTIAMLIRNLGITLMFLLRRPSQLTSKRIIDWIVAIAGTCICYFYKVSGAKPILPSLAPAAYVLMVVAVFLSAIAVVNLGRSFGVVPANRGIRTKGFYSVVRHPLYALYMLLDIGWILLCFSYRNLCVFVLYCLLSYSRAKFEEKLLRQDPAYQEYALKTRYMFLPGII